PGEAGGERASQVQAEEMDPLREGALELAVAHGLARDQGHPMEGPVAHLLRGRLVPAHRGTRRLSHTLTSSFSVEVLDAAIKKYDTPRSVISDHGSTFCGVEAK